MLLSLVLNGGLFISEEKIFMHYHIEPLKVTGTEGFWGIILSLIFIPMYNFIQLPESFNGGICGPVPCD
jgi:hypothetical protein